MSYIFRSDAVSVGDRVVARREFGGTHSDVIGHVLSTSPLVIRPQAVGGYPSDLEAVEIPAEQLKIIKKLSPRTVRNSEIRAVEVAAAAARGGTKVWTNDGQWLMRFGEGTDSAIPLGPSAGFMPAPMEEIDAFYAEHNLPTRLAIPERIGKAALRVLDNEPAAWQLEPEVLAFTRSLDTASAEPHLDSALFDATLSQSGDERVWLGISLLGNATPSQLEALLAWGKANGAENAFVEVEASESAALALLSEVGFLEHHRRGYAVRKGGTL